MIASMRQTVSRNARKQLKLWFVGFNASCDGSRFTEPKFSSEALHAGTGDTEGRDRIGVSEIAAAPVRIERLWEGGGLGVTAGGASQTLDKSGAVGDK